MLVLVGFILVVISTLGGFMLAGGHPAVLLHLSEFVVIFGIATGILIIASPGHVLSDLTGKARLAFSSKKPKKEEYFDLLKLLYEIFMVGRRNGLIALEEHVMEPAKSAIFQRYPVVTAHQERMEFLCNGLRPVIDGKIKPDQLEDLMLTELDAKIEEADHPVHVLQMVGDSLPGIGIVAAVLGIINTMAAIADGPSVVGERVAAALTGTLLGVFSAYGFVNPMATRIKFNNAHDQQYLRCILAAVSGFAKGLAPVTAVEVARRSLDSGVQPTAEELETAVKGLSTTAR
ncbi:MAG: MotA/TolQ/ExbB proton channel family protein [Opitutaceae bacterium]|nr:MotA/TolQ/ExbB proton channel family protein [Opitutaceae bacterium]